MELFIRIVDGQPFEHPIFGNNFREAFPDVDTENLPPQFARFVRVAPTPSESEIPTSSSYIWDGDVVTEIWSYAPMPEWQQEWMARGKIETPGSEPNVIG